MSAELVGTQSSVNHEGLFQGWGTLSQREIIIVGRTNKAEIRLEELNENAESCWENLRNEI